MDMVVTERNLTGMDSAINIETFGMSVIHWATYMETDLQIGKLSSTYEPI